MLQPNLCRNAVWTRTARAWNVAYSAAVLKHAMWTRVVLMLSAYHSHTQLSAHVLQASLAIPILNAHTVCHLALCHLARLRYLSINCHNQ